MGSLDISAWPRISRETWLRRRKEHRQKLEPLVKPYIEARSTGLKDPIKDFLFEYYSFRPSKLMRWSPGAGVVLEGASAEDFPSLKGLAAVEGGAVVSTESFSPRRRKGASWIKGMLEATKGRAPFLGCFGMHEWAMVYKSPAVRHEKVSMRMSPAELASFVESRPIVCSHHDAFRFFTPEARPLNKEQPSFENMAELEQPGCLHTNMDLYRWSYKQYPWIPGDILADTFILAMEAREIDMRASPYDLAAKGFDPIPIETQSGRQLYLELQQALELKSRPLRDRLIDAYGRLLTLV